MNLPPPPFGSGILFDQIMVGAGTSLLNLIIHAILLGGVVWTVRRLEVKDTFVPAFAQYTVVIVSTGALLVAAHLLEVMIWSVTYDLVGAAPPGSDLIYFAFQNYTTLGYGDILPVYGWRLLAPMTALNGIMLIGWSTALILHVLSKAAKT
jgi:hypothetical protein